MKDWNITPSEWGIDLVHIHCDEGVGWLCNRSPEGKWYCFSCGHRPPQEIEDVADLTGCWYNVESVKVEPQHIDRAKTKL